MPVLQGLIDYANENITSFHMPGHKNNNRNFKELDIIRENMYKFDKTEVPGLDNLHMPEEMIKEAQEAAARAYKARESFFLINGSTCGIYSMILGVTRPGDKIIVQRNCHRSVYMACLMGNLDTVYITPKVLEDFNIPVSVDKKDIIGLMDENPDARAVILTYPTYYGTCCDLESIAAEVHKRGMLLLVDEAHGAHLAFNKRLPKSSLECGADISVVSLHKTTPALTQTALLNINRDVDVEGIKFMLRLFQSTSPSYMLMASIDGARYIMEERGEHLLDELLDNLEGFRNKILNISGYTLLGKEHIGKSFIHDVDITKIVILSSLGGRELERLLRKEHRIQVEMSDVYTSTLICSIGDSREVFERLFTALYDISKKYKGSSISKAKLNYVKYKPVLNMRDAYYKPKRKVKLRDAEGLISGEMVSPYPPGIPVLLPGEVITREIIEHLQICKDYGIPLNGINDAKGEFINVAEI